MRAYLTALYFLFIFSLSAGAQSLRGIIIDKETKNPIPYVNIGCVEKGIGTVSNVDGTFSINGLKQGDKLLISSIGYQKISHVIDAKSELKLSLKPEVTVLDEVTVKSSKIDRAKFKIKGQKIKRRSYSMGFAGKQLGTEIGALIKINKPYMVSKAVIPIDRIGDNTILKFRINIYDFNKGSIGPNLIEENIIVNCPSEKGNLIVDLENYNLTLQNDVVLMLELIQDELGDGNQTIMFRAKKGGNNIYWRQTSFATYSKISNLFKGAPTLSLGFYFEGYEY